VYKKHGNETVNFLHGVILSGMPKHGDFGEFFVLSADSLCSSQIVGIYKIL